MTGEKEDPIRFTHPHVGEKVVAALSEEVFIVTRLADLGALAGMMAAIHQMFPDTALGKDAAVIDEWCDKVAAVVGKRASWKK